MGHFMKKQQLEKIVEEQSDLVIENSTFESSKGPLIRNKNSTKFDSADFFMQQQKLDKIVEEQQKFLKNIQNCDDKRKRPLIKKENVSRFDSAQHEMEKIGKKICELKGF